MKERSMVKTTLTVLTLVLMGFGWIGTGVQLAHATIPTVNFGPTNPGVSNDMSGQYNHGEKAGHAAYWAAQGHEYDPKCPSGHTTAFCKGFNDALNAEYAFDSS